jgi:hypothetical protein
MTTTFGVLTFIILCLTAFVSYRNNQRLELEIEDKNTSLTNKDINQKELKLREGILAQLLADIPVIQEETRVALEEEAKLKDQNAKLKAAVESKTKKIASNDRDYKEMNEKLLLVGEPTGLVDKAKDMKVLSLELDELIKNKEAKLKNLNAENESAADLGSRLKFNLDTIGRGESLPTLKTKIRQIYPNWGFVTLANGYQSGVTGGSSLYIVRDNVVIGKLMVTTVERSSASASIVPESIAQDITLRVGDEVHAVPPKVDDKVHAVSPKKSN